MSVEIPQQLDELERLAWDVQLAPTRTWSERERVARYITDLVEPLAGMTLAVGVSTLDEHDVVAGCVVQADLPDADKPFWVGRIMGNIVGAAPKAMAYSVVLFAFRDGRRVPTGPRDGDVLRWFSVMWKGPGPNAWDAGTYDEWGEWEGTRGPFDLVADDEISDAVNAALVRLGLRSGGS